MASLDLLIMQGLSPTQSITPTLVSLDFGYPSLSVTGVQKAAQQWLTQLLTEKGTVFSDSEFGTTFLTQLKSANLGDDTVLTGVFAECAKDIQRWNSANLDLAGIPDDEIITSATVLEIARIGTAITFTVDLLTAAGTSRTYTVPIPVGAPS